jgi:hypothetical protein
VQLSGKSESRFHSMSRSWAKSGITSEKDFPGSSWIIGDEPKPIPSAECSANVCAPDLVSQLLPKEQI